MPIALSTAGMLAVVGEVAADVFSGPVGWAILAVTVIGIAKEAGFFDCLWDVITNG